MFFWNEDRSQIIELTESINLLVSRINDISREQDILSTSMHTMFRKLEEKLSLDEKLEKCVSATVIAKPRRLRGRPKKKQDDKL